MRAVLIRGRNVDQVWRKALREIKIHGETQTSRLGNTKEIRHVTMEVQDPIDRLVFSRSMNPAYSIAEVVWILAGANKSSFLEFWNPRMFLYLDTDKSFFYGAYGKRLGSKPKLSTYAEKMLRVERNENVGSIDQLKSAVYALKESSHSRQVVFQIWRSDLDFPNPYPRSLDVPCNLVSHLLVRNDELEWMQVMRSTDIAWGLPYNLVQFTTLQEIMAGWLGISVGTFIHFSDSLHLYERHWQYLDRWSEASHQSNFGKPKSLALDSYEDWEDMFRNFVDLVLRLTVEKKRSDLLSIIDQRKDFPGGYSEWLALLGSDALRRRGFLSEAKEMISLSGKYWAKSWLKWESTKRVNKNLDIEKG